MQQTKLNKTIDGVVKSGTFPKKILESEQLSKTNSLKYSSLKLVGVGLFAVIFMIGLSSVGSTISYFNDEEISIGNRLVADPLSFSVDIASSSSVQIDLSHGEQLIVPFMLPGSDSEPIQYFVTSSFTGGDNGFCAAIHAMGTWPLPYDGALLSLQTSTTTDVGSWALTFSLPDVSIFSNTSCTVDLVYSGWNADVPFGKGYRDEQKFSITFYIPDIPKSLPAATPTTLVSEPDQPSSGSIPSPEIVPESVPEVVPEVPPVVPESVTESIPETVVETPAPSTEPIPEVTDSPTETPPVVTTEAGAQ